MKYHWTVITILVICLLGGFVTCEHYVINGAAIDTERIANAVTAKGEMSDDTIKYLIEMFRSETDTMIYKATVWVGFWMSILAIVMILPTLHQMNEQRKAREEVNASIKTMNEKYGEIETRVKTRLIDLESGIEESRISHIMTCISNIPDPILVQQKKGKQLAKSYLKLLYKESVRFENLIGRMHEDYKAGRSKRIEEEMPYINLIVVEILTSLSKAQIVFHDAGLNMEFYDVIRVASRQFEHVCSESLDIDSVKGAVNVINQKFLALINQIEGLPGSFKN